MFLPHQTIACYFLANLSIIVNVCHSSVTRFGENSPIGQDFRSFWQNFKCLICEPALALKVCYWAIFLCCKIAEFWASDLAIWSHLPQGGWGGGGWMDHHHIWHKAWWMNERIRVERRARFQILKEEQILDFKISWFKASRNPKMHRIKNQ